MGNLMTTLLLLIMVFAASVKASNFHLHNQNILGAIEEMQKANYFTFVMLLNIAPPDLFAKNVTFLMPTNSTLANAAMQENAVADFLLQQSIHSPLLFDNLIHFPTGSLLPTSSPDLMLKVTNHGRQSFFLNNVRIRSPNICTRGSSIRCHGIDGVLQPTGLHVPPQPSFSWTNNSNPPAAAPVPSVSPPSPTTDNSLNPDHPAPGAIPPFVDSTAGKQNSGSHRRNDHEGLLFQIIINILLIVVSYIIWFT